MNTRGKLCPACKNENEETASFCRHCGAFLDDYPTELVAIPESPDSPINAPSLQAESFIDIASIPEEGIGIYVAGASKPLYTPVPGEIVLGRATDTLLATEAFLDLSNLNAGSMGVSRRHVMIRRVSSGFEVLDLSSRNGTWLNAERLVPNKPYPLSSGSQLRIGHMRLLIMHRLLPAK